MKYRFAVLTFLIVLVIVVTACGGAATEPNYDQAVGGAAAPEMYVEPAIAPEAAKSGEGVAEGGAASLIPVSPGGGENLDANTALLDAAAVAYRTDRMIIKNGDIRLLVDDPDVAIDRMTQVITDMGGYTISSRVWFQDAYGTNYKYATITMGVPVENFEPALRRLRALAVRVLDENASGEDVTDQFVDLESELVNLKATEARVRTFLEQATTVDEALRVNEELSKIQAQIEEVQGRMNYLKDRTSFSTITVNIEPVVPTPTPQPTPTITPTRTPAPSPTVTPWPIKETISDAGQSLTQSYQGLAEFFIWFIIAVFPILLPFILIIWLLWKLFGPKPKKKSAAPPTDPKPE